MYKLDRPRNVTLFLLFIFAVGIFLWSVSRIAQGKTFDYTAAISALGSVAGVILIITQLMVSVEQTDMMRTQTKILENQAAILTARPVMLLTFDNNTRYYGPLQLHGATAVKQLTPTRVHNQGTANAVTYTIEILVPWYNAPGEDLILRHDDTKISKVGHYAWGMRNWIRYKTIVDVPVMAGDSENLTLLVFDIPIKTAKWDIGWRIIVGDKVYPESGLYGMLEITVEA